MRLYRNKNYPNRWYAHTKSAGWVMFPDEPDGWMKRQPARGIDPLYFREERVELAFKAGIPGSPAAGPQEDISAAV